ncbi:YcxB family protein [Acinetobacter sp. MD2(2019)]|uniref:YcxB family protein n=1 Tax=Acinetobacter sp. MD2(2019) TaxID=2605273 RepID=UPI002D1EC397|nr:YcxB family protein [Acinetobacter sp. MD2(2019)]MEB3753001.1 YcxB family protein [Acinetobacter sp. MD2(2019)]
MIDQKPALSVRYLLNLEESQDGFALATFGKKQFTRFLTPVISLLVVVYGFYIGATGVGRYYIGLGLFFLALQGLMRYWLLPTLFKRQFVKYQLGKSEQGFDLFQSHFDLWTNGRQQRYPYAEVQNCAEGKLTYLLEFKTRNVVIVPKRVFANLDQQQLFARSFKK